MEGVPSPAMIVYAISLLKFCGMLLAGVIDANSEIVISGDKLFSSAPAKLNVIVLSSSLIIPETGSSSIKRTKENILFSELSTVLDAVTTYTLSSPFSAVTV